MTGVVDFTALVARAEHHIESGNRRIIGIAGPPGSGKSTLAGQLVAALGGRAVLVPMDGFHLADAELSRLGRRGRKGAPDTFDADGYLSLLRRLRDNTAAVVYAPRFDRRIDDPVAGAIPVAADVPLVVTEGNYLLLESGSWQAIPALLDEVWYLDLDEPTRLRRLISRHIEFGKDAAAARAWVRQVDQRNAAVIARTRARADLVVDAAALAGANLDSPSGR